MDVLCDSSFLMNLVSKPTTCQDKVEYEVGPLRFIVPSNVIAELEAMKRRVGQKRSKMAETAITIANSNFEVRSIGDLDSNVDDLLIEYATRNRCAVATVDRVLLRRLIANDVLVITFTKNRMIIANHYRP
jgi:rRNA-processing protein FCF1